MSRRRRDRWLQAASTCRYRTGIAEGRQLGRPSGRTGRRFWHIFRSCLSAMDSQIHDYGYRYLFQDPVFLRQLLTTCVNEPWVYEIDFDTVELLTTVHIDKRLLRREDDMLFRVRMGGREAYLVILLEFMSQPERFMALRLLLYQCQVWMSLVERAQRRKRPLRLLPPIFPVVLYNGLKPWNGPLRLEDLVERVGGDRAPGSSDGGVAPGGAWRDGAVDGAADGGRAGADRGGIAGPWAYVPGYTYRVIDQGRVELKVLRRAGNLISALFRVQNIREESEAVLAEVPRWLLEAARSVPDAVDRFYQWFLVRFHEENRRPGELRARDLATIEEIRNMLEPSFEKWKRDLLAEGDREARLRMARKLLGQGMPLEQVAEIVELPLEEVRALLG